jgi:predicted adenylyl cyclase CyaB
VVVEKHREILLYENVRIHLDQVAGLGEFLEFEAVLGEGDNAADGHRKVDWLTQRLGISTDRLIQGSYADLRE